MEEASYQHNPDKLPLDTDEAGERLTRSLDSIYEQIERVQIELPKTEEVLHKVVEAAEHNQAIEKLFELRHEVKDDSNQPQASSTASMAGLMEQKAQQLQVAMQTASKQPVRQKGMRSYLPAGNSLYGQAITYGFVTALLSLLVAIIAVGLFT